MIGVGVAAGCWGTRAGVGLAFGVLSVTTSFTGVAVGSGVWPLAVAPKNTEAVKSDTKQKTTLVIAGKIEEIICPKGLNLQGVNFPQA